MWMSTNGQGTKCSRKIAENYNRLSRVHERYRQTDRQTTDRRATAYSELEHEFTFTNYPVSLSGLLTVRNQNWTVKSGQISGQNQISGTSIASTHVALFGCYWCICQTILWALWTATINNFSSANKHVQLFSEWLRRLLLKNDFLNLSRCSGYILWVNRQIYKLLVREWDATGLPRQPMEYWPGDQSWQTCSTTSNLCA